MIRTDVHTHTLFSADGISPLREMIAAARRLDLSVYGVSDHFDYDYPAQNVETEEGFAYIDEAAYFAALRQEQAALAGKMLLLAGGEFGYSSSKRCTEEYERVIGEYSPDFIVNSVHSVGKYDVYFPAYFEGQSKRDAYMRYFDRVRESLDAPYRYEIVGHLGYISHNAPYPDRKLRYEDFPDILDEILRAVIAKGKLLEVNSSARGSGGDCLPDYDVLTRYFQLGGRKLSFGSDAHGIDRVGEGRERIGRKLKELGFEEITVPYAGRELKFPL